MADVEHAQARGRPVVDNPYQYNPTTSKLQSVLYILVSGYGLHYFKFYGVILRSPHVRHEWFKVGLALTVAILTIKAYLELYEGRVRKTKINYKNYPQTTHTILALIIFASLSFNVALWPHYGWNTPVLLGVFFFGCVINLLLLLPTPWQNAVAFVLLTFFLQEYQ